MSVLTVVFILIGLALFYLLFTLFLTYLVQQLPRHPVEEAPDWGSCLDTRIPTPEGGFLEVWRVEPEVRSSKGIVLFAHGWGRNRDRMVPRARIFAEWGFTCVIHSARDHGKSSKKRFMNAARFAEDIATVMRWLKEPVILYGHSAGSAGAIIAAAGNKEMVRLLILEASYARTKEALYSLYCWVNPLFGLLFARMILFWMDLFYGGMLNDCSPVRLAKEIDMPVMIVHGEQDRRFPVAFAHELKAGFVHEKVEMYIGPGAGHSDSSLTPGYRDAVKAFIDRYLK
ncbi:MAG: alpha/beta fold hydrolase [Deltaproteobacteria bacterium]|nr:alpha/beta fold hydrolase [Deltaproteobacteria bacterium]